MTSEELFEELKQFFATSVSEIGQRLKDQEITVTKKEFATLERQLLIRLSRFADEVEYKRQSE